MIAVVGKKLNKESKNGQKKEIRYIESIFIRKKLILEKVSIFKEGKMKLKQSNKSCQHKKIYCNRTVQMLYHKKGKIYVFDDEKEYDFQDIVYRCFDCNKVLDEDSLEFEE